MTMRKLFRMKYEPCSGQCYDHRDVLRISGLGGQVEEMAALLAKIVKIHEPACGNLHLAYGLDLDEETNTFVASFQHYGAIELFVAPNAFKALNDLADVALAYYATDAYAEAVKAQPGVGHDVCEHGNDQDLRHFALQYSGLPEAVCADVMMATANA